MNDTVKIYKNLGTGYLDSIPVYRLANVHANKVEISQISSYIEPYATFHGTTSDKDEIIIKQGDSVKIYLNNNSNSTSLSTIIYTGFTYITLNDFKTADFNHDGYNDLVVVEDGYGINVYKNTGGTIGTTAVYTNIDPPFFHPQSVAVGDFDKNGWNDIALCLGNKTTLYLNNKSTDIFDMTPTETVNLDVNNTGPASKMIVADLYNKGGLAILFSHHFDIAENNPYDPYNDIDKLVRINASDTDAVPAPPIQFRSYFLKDGIYRPRIYMYNRGDRDFNKYRIYKRTPRLPDSLVYIGETTSNSFIDTTEYITENPAGTAPVTFNCIYFSTCTDHTSHESINSDTAKYLVGDDIVCMECIEGGDAMSSNTTTVFNQGDMKYNITNFPNPFNPATKIYYTIPLSGYVSIIVYNSLGQTVKELVNEFKNKGSHTADFNGSNLSSGIYFYKLRSGSFEVVRRMVLLK